MPVKTSYICDCCGNECFKFYEISHDFGTNIIYCEKCVCSEVNKIIFNLNKTEGHNCSLNIRCKFNKKI